MWSYSLTLSVGIKVEIKFFGLEESEVTQLCPDSL